MITILITFPHHAFAEDIVPNLGININSALVDPSSKENALSILRREIAYVFYDLKSLGGVSARWLPDDIWPRWKCTKDAEIAPGVLDPDWYVVVSALLDAAHADGVTVTIVLSDMATGVLFGSAPPLEGGTETRGPSPSIPNENYQTAQARCANGLAPYYPHSEAALFASPTLQAEIQQRFVTMARFLARFPALAGIELFNEPDFSLTHTPAYWRTVDALLRAVKNADPALANVPVYSGTAWWDKKIVAEAKAAGALDLEPFLTVHAYDDYTRSENEVETALDGLVDYLHGLAPDKQIIIAEAGSKVPLTRLEDNAKMIRQLLRLYLTRHVGVWFWGDWFQGDHDVDYKWDFSPRSAAGPSLAPYFFDAAMMDKYAQPRRVAEAPGGGELHDVMLSVEKTDDPNPFQNGVWSLRLDSQLFLGFSRAGAFPRRADPPEAFAAPPPTYFTSEGAAPREWAAISQTPLGWRLDQYQCAARVGGCHRHPGSFARAR